MKNLKYMINILYSKRNDYKENFCIPEVWNKFGYDRVLYRKNGEIGINPYDYFSYCIENHILHYADKNISYLEPIGLTSAGLMFNTNKGIIYSILIRMFTAWYHTEKADLSSGTFLKTICLLPYLKSLGVNIVYLLPIFEYSSKYKKGEAGSPYAIKNIYKLDKNLHDPLLGEYTESLLETEFKAFIEACHILGMHVMVDFVFRTVSRDNDLLVEHPDWFYWINLKYSNNFTSPVAEKVKEPFLVDEKSMVYLYSSKRIKEYLAQFTHSPDKINFVKWERLVKRHKKTGENILELIESEFGITTVPGFSNVVNDRQPPWTDVTFLRYYFDTHKEAIKYISDEQPPYIMQDGVCHNIFRGQLENKELREYITAVIPYYQKKYGIDGARIDMGHSLSSDLNMELIDRIKSNNKSFILWSEEFDPEKSKEAKEYGFDFINGNIRSIYKKIDDSHFNQQLINDSLLKAEIPMIAALETPDTPRASLVYKDKDKLSLLVFLNCFIPNTIPFINNGMEVMEIQPMNLGLDNMEEGRYVLEKSDLMYGKLAFFDHYCIHWKNKDLKWMMNLLSCAIGIRKSYIEVLTKKENFIEQPKIMEHEKITFLCYFDKNIQKGIFILANRSEKKIDMIDLKQLIPEHICVENLTIIYAKDRYMGAKLLAGQRKNLEPYEVVIGGIQ